MSEHVIKRLPKWVIPRHYSIKLHPLLFPPFQLVGTICTDIEVTQITSSISLNSLQLIVSNVYLDNQEPAGISYEEKCEFVVFTFSNPIQPGAHRLSFDFTGTLNAKLEGFYRARYIGRDGQEHYMAATYLEPTAARRAFPCFDEPALKATFDVTLVALRDQLALSNMPVLREDAVPEDPTLKAVVFERTPLISTFLLAFIVGGEFETTEQRDEDGVVHRLYAPFGKLEHARRILDLSLKMLPFFNRYYGIKYPLSKLDHIDVPEFGAGAMENWGLITYRELHMLAPPDVSASVREGIPLTLGHELTHMWFGDLVTMDWWPNLWLLEGFASLMMFVGGHECAPELDIWSSYPSTMLSSALELDALHSSHAIEAPVRTPGEIYEFYDVIAYRKAGAIMNMLREYIGDELFRAGTREYLKQHAYGNASAADVWAAFDAATGQSVSAMMRPWTQLKGFPIVTVVDEKLVENGLQLTLRTEKFNANGTSDPFSKMWPIPLLVGTRRNPTPKQPHYKCLLKEATQTITIPDVAAHEWVTLNCGAAGFYRVHYSSKMREALLSGVRDASLPRFDRYAVVSDLFALMFAEKLSVREVLDACLEFAGETEYCVWLELLTQLGLVAAFVRERRGPAAEWKAYCRYLQKLLERTAVRLGCDPIAGESLSDSMLRGLVFGKLAGTGLEDTIARARNLFAAQVADPVKNAIASDLRSAVYSIVLNTEDDGQTLEQLIELYQQSSSSEERVRILKSLGSVPSQKLMKRVLDFIFSSEVQKQDRQFGLQGAATSVMNRDVTLRYLRDHWDAVLECEVYNVLPKIVKSLVSGFMHVDGVSQVREFFAAHEHTTALHAVKQAIETIELHSKQLSQLGAPLVQYFLSC